jgi:hypothetical protein
MNETIRLPRPLLLGIAVGQGLLLFALYKAFDANVWPSESPLWSYPLWTLAIAAPVLLLLSIDTQNLNRILPLAGSFAAILALAAVYTGWQAEPFGAFQVQGLTMVFALSMAIACFKALMYIQQRANLEPMAYDVLFTYSWRNFLVLGLSALFVLAFGLILLLWAALFKVIGIDFFEDLFRKDWFLFPVLGFAHGLGVIIFRELTHVIDNITRLLRGLIKLLLPLVVGVSVVFLAALPFTGLDVLWSTGSGTGLLLWLTAVILFFTNAVYQDGRGEDPYPAFVHRLIFAGLCALPVLSILSFYGLVLRLDQYGWTVQRSWAFVVWLILALFSAGYFYGIATRRIDWPKTLASVNTGMGLLMLALMLLANSPVLDFRKLSLSSQLSRVESGEIAIEEFDFYYAKTQLARPGYLALEDMKSSYADSNPEVIDLIQNARPRMARAVRMDREAFWDNAVYRPEPFELPRAVRSMLENTGIVGRGMGQALIVRIDLNDDGQDEYALIQMHESLVWNAQYFFRSPQGWEIRRLALSGQPRPGPDVAEMLRSGNIELRESDFKDLQIGDLVFVPN